jgi:hypothetical protein
MANELSEDRLSKPIRTVVTRVGKLNLKIAELARNLGSRAKTCSNAQKTVEC